MDRINEELLGKLLNEYSVEPPSEKLLERTRMMMGRQLAARREELLAVAPAAHRVERPMGIVVSTLVLSLLICCNLFYAATVGTVLRLLLPSSADVYLTHSLIGISVAGTVIIIGMVMTATGKVFMSQRSQVRIPVTH
jgi:hypothetical protein